MSIKKRIKLIMPSMFLLFILFSPNAYAGFWDRAEGITTEAGIPIPSGAQKIMTRDFEMMGQSRKLTTYKCYLTDEEILEFYQRQLPKYGWTEKESLAKLLKQYNVSLPNTEELSGLGIDLQKVTKNILRFNKADNSLTIMIMPVKDPSGATLFSLDFGKDITKSPNYLPPEGVVPQPAQKLDFMPVYPNSMLISHIDKNYVYSCQDDIEAVVAFYKQKMFSYGWQLIEESGITQSKLDPLSVFNQDSDASSGCPSCSEAQKEELKSQLQSLPAEIKAGFEENSVILKANLDFVKSNAERLKMRFSQLKMGQPQLGTQITVSYYEK